MNNDKLKALIRKYVNRIDNAVLSDVDERNAAEVILCDALKEALA